VDNLNKEIAESKKAEEKFIASELRYRRLFETAQDGILILDAETGMIVDVNPFLVKMLGYSHETFLGKAIWDIGFFRDIIANKDNYLELQQKKYVRYEDLPLETSDGRRIEVEFVSNVYDVLDKKVIQCNIRDITDRKKAEREKEHLFIELQEAFDNIKTLQSMLPICSYCKKIRNDKGYWEQVETYISKHTDTVFSHGMCPKCAEKAMKELEEFINNSH
jgi:PAS domain S-box-containing protein